MNRYRLEPFTPDSTDAYIKHRLRLAGCPRMPFQPPAIEALHRRSGGTPRVINTLCDNALFEAFLARSAEIGAELVEQIADNLGLETGLHGKRGAIAPPRPTPKTLPPNDARPTPPAPMARASRSISDEPPPVADEPIEGDPITAEVAVPVPPPTKPRSVDLAEIDRYLEGLNKL